VIGSGVRRTWTSKKRGGFRQARRPCQKPRVLSGVHHVPILDMWTRSAASMPRPLRSVIGLHFFSPAHIMKLLCILFGRPKRSQAALWSPNGFALARRWIRFRYRTSGDVRTAFIGNRILAHLPANRGPIIWFWMVRPPYRSTRHWSTLVSPMGPVAVAIWPSLTLAGPQRKAQGAKRATLPNACRHTPIKTAKAATLRQRPGKGFLHL